MPSLGALPVPLTDKPTHESRYLAIGRQVSATCDVWECQWGHTSDGTESLSSFGEEATGCLQRFSGLSRLGEHYQSAHGLFHEQDPPFMWKCRSCQFLNDCEQLCPHCQRPLSGWEKWYYGYVAVRSLLESLPAASVRASDPASGFATSLSSAFSSRGGYNSFGMPSFTTGCYSPGSGPGGSFNQRCLEAPSKVFGGRPAPTSCCLCFPSLALVLALASCLQAYGSASVYAGAVAGWWANEVTALIQAGLRWKWNSERIRTMLSVAVFPLMLFLGHRALPRFRRSLGRNLGGSKRNNEGPRIRACC